MMPTTATTTKAKTTIAQIGRPAVVAVGGIAVGLVVGCCGGTVGSTGVVTGDDWNNLRAAAPPSPPLMATMTNTVSRNTITRDSFERVLGNARSCFTFASSHVARCLTTRIIADGVPFRQSGLPSMPPSALPSVRGVSGNFATLPTSHLSLFVHCGIICGRGRRARLYASGVAVLAPHRAETGSAESGRMQLPVKCLVSW